MGKSQELVAKCKLEEITLNEAEEALAKAIFTNSVKTKEIALTIWGKIKILKDLDRERKIRKNSAALGYSEQVDRTR